MSSCNVPTCTMTSRSDVENFFVDDVIPEVGVSFSISVNKITCGVTSSSFRLKLQVPSRVTCRSKLRYKFRFPSRNVHMSEKAKAEYDFAALNSLTLSVCGVVRRTQIAILSPWQSSPNFFEYVALNRVKIARKTRQLAPKNPNTV